MRSDLNTEVLRYYYDAQNVIAEYDPTDNLSRRYIHGTTEPALDTMRPTSTDELPATAGQGQPTVSRVDERAVQIEGAGSQTDTYYYLLQELYTVTGLMKKNGTLAEANVYDAYGKVHQWSYRDFDFNRDGDVDSSDYALLLAVYSGAGNATGYPMADGDMDGDSDEDDNTLFTAAQTSSGEPPITLYTSAVGNPYHFTGRRLFMLETDPSIFNPIDPEPNHQLQYNRNRHYDPENGRWLQRDPLGTRELVSFDRKGAPSVVGDRPPLRLVYDRAHLKWLDRNPWAYADGMNLYEYVGSQPIHMLDPFGLAKKCTKKGDECHDFEVVAMPFYNMSPSKSDKIAWIITVSAAETLTCSSKAKLLDKALPVPGGVIPDPYPGIGESLVGFTGLTLANWNHYHRSIWHRTRCMTCKCGWGCRLTLGYASLTWQGQWSDWKKCGVELVPADPGVTTPAAGEEGYQWLLERCTLEAEEKAKKACGATAKECS